MLLKSTVTPASTSFCTSSWSICASLSKYAWYSPGVVSFILASFCSSLASIGYCRSAILASLTSFGISDSKTFLSTVTHSEISVSSVPSPWIFLILIMSWSIWPSSSTFSNASTNSFAILSRFVKDPFPDMDVLATFISSSSWAGIAISSNTSRVLFFDSSNPFTIVDVGIPCSISFSASFNISPTNTTAVVVPSPYSSSCIFARSTIIFAAGWSGSVSLSTV